MSPRVQRRLCSLLAFASGFTHLVLASATGRHFRSPLGALEYPEAAIVGARYLVVVGGLTLVLLSRPLLHGKRTAWWVALVIAAGSIPAHHIKHADLLGVAAAVALVVALLASRRSFRVRSDPARARQGWQLLGFGLAVVFVYGVAGLYLLNREFPERATLFLSAVETLRLLVLLPASTIEPATRHGSWFIDSVRVGALVVVFATVVRLVATTVLRRGHTDDDEAVVRPLLARYATTALAPFHLLDDKLWFIASDRAAFVGYKLVGRCAVVLGEPIGAPGSVELVLAEFLELCDANGWVPAFHQVTAMGAQQLREAGISALKIGEEAIVSVQEWSIDDKQYKSLRSALRRVERAGYRLIELPQPIGDETMEELRAVSDSWLASSGHRERTFTLGRFDPAYLRATTVIAAVDEHGRIGAFTNILPSYRSSDGNFDLMRRSPNTPNGLMEFLFVGLIDRFRQEGRTGMNLGLAPLAGVEGDGLPHRALRLLHERGEQAFNFKGLAAFKEKWQPRWEPRYLCYRRAADLPLIAAAVTRAGELRDERSLWERGVKLTRRYPVTIALFGVIFWFMIVTHIDRDSHATLMRQLGLRWGDLLHLQMWRLATSQLVQTKAGFAWGNIALLLPILPLAEWRLGSRRSVVVFALGDWLSTVPVLIGVRIAAAMGDAAAARTLAERDGGASSGAWALATAIALSLPGGRWRTGAIVVILGFNGGALVVEHKLVDIQHLLAIAMGFCLVRVLDARQGMREETPNAQRGELSRIPAAPRR